MKLYRGDMFKAAEHPAVDALIITTNGFVKTNGSLVMGRGCARVAMELWEIDKGLGTLVRQSGNHVHHVTNVEHGENMDLAVVSFPVKPVRGDNSLERFRDWEKPVPGWACVADVNIIKRSCDELLELAGRLQWEMVLMPKPGCGYGELSWATVKDILATKLDGRFVVCDHMNVR